MEQLPLEIQEQILDRVPTKDVVRYCLANKKLREVCHDDYYWHQRAEDDFHTTEVNNMAEYNQLATLYMELIDVHTERISFFGTIGRVLARNGQRGDGPVSKELSDYMLSDERNKTRINIPNDLKKEYTKRFYPSEKWLLLHGRRKDKLSTAQKVGLDQVVEWLIEVGEMGRALIFVQILAYDPEYELRFERLSMKRLLTWLRGETQLTVMQRNAFVRFFSRAGAV